MVEISWVLKPGGRSIELLTSVAEFRRLAEQVARERQATGRVVVTIRLSLAGDEGAGRDAAVTSTFGPLWDSWAWAVYQDEPR